MFGRKQRRHSVIDTLVGSNSEVNGDVHFAGGCHIDGTVKGSVSADPESGSEEESGAEKSRRPQSRPEKSRRPFQAQGQGTEVRQCAQARER